MVILADNNSSVMDKTSPGLPAPAETLDITREVCPMTYVRTRLALDRLHPGELLEVLLKGDEPRRNVPATALSQGHQVLLAEHRPDGVTRLLLQRG
jgi:TusA-related sulfurtransferase